MKIFKRLGCGEDGGLCDWRVCVKKGRKKPRSFFISLLPIILVIVIWPFIGIYRQYVFTTPFPYPLTLAFIVNLVMFTLGSIYFGFTIARHGFTCGKHHRKVKKPKFDENGKQIKRKGPETPISIAYKFVHWAFFPSLFCSIFVYAAYSSIVPCYDNPNLCTLIFRADLWLSALVFLSIAKAKRRGGRLDWIVAIILCIGILTFQWNNKEKVNLTLAQNMFILIGGALTCISFGMFTIMLRKATLSAGIFKILWVMSFWGIIFMMPLSIFFDRNAGWHVAYDDPTKNPDWGVIWHMVVLVFALIFWMWAIVMAVAYSETLIVSLALAIALFLGDFGIYSYILHGFTFSAANIVGIILCAIPIAWLLKRLVMVSCPSLFGGLCGKIFGEENPNDPEEELDLLGDGFLDDEDNDDFGTPAKFSSKKSSSHHHSNKSSRDYGTYGATEGRNPLYSVVEDKRDDSRSYGSQQDYSDDDDDYSRSSDKSSRKLEKSRSSSSMKDKSDKKSKRGSSHKDKKKSSRV